MNLATALDTSGVSVVAGVPAVIAVSVLVGNHTAPCFPAVSGVPAPAGVLFLVLCPCCQRFYSF
jgi:hypothetical protein